MDELFVDFFLFSCFFRRVSLRSLFNTCSVSIKPRNHSTLLLFSLIVILLQFVVVYNLAVSKPTLQFFFRFFRFILLRINFSRFSLIFSNFCTSSTIVGVEFSFSFGYRYCKGYILVIWHNFLFPYSFFIYKVAIIFPESQFSLSSCSIIDDTQLRCYF